MSCQLWKIQLKLFYLAYVAVYFFVIIIIF